MTVDMTVTKAAAGEPLGRALLAGLKDLCRPHVVARNPVPRREA